jgi:hypothetical protein
VAIKILGRHTLCWKYQIREAVSEGWEME